MKNNLIISALAASLIFSSCGKDPVDPPVNNYTVPTTYNFSNKNYQDQTNVLNTLTSIDDLSKTGTTATIDASAMKSKFKGQVSGTVNIHDLTFSAEAQALLESYFDKIALASQSYTNANPANGTAGVGSYVVNGKTSKYLLSAEGINYQQLISKMMMGSVLYNQIVQKLSEGSIGSSVDNTTATANGTLMEHHWDEAFGYFGVPDSFPLVTTGSKYLGNYSNQVNAGIGSNATLMNAFLKGRAAISNKDMLTKQVQANIIVAQIEVLMGAAAIHELNEMDGVTSTARIHTLLSESMGFILAIKHSPKKKMTNAQADQILGYFGDNIYEITNADLENVKNTLTSIYGFTNPDDI